MGKLFAILLCLCAALLAFQKQHSITSYTTTAVSLRANPGDTARVLAQLAGETRLEIIACDGSWWCRATYNGTRGYLPKAALYTQRISATGVQEPSAGRGSATIPLEVLRAIVTTKDDLRKLILAEEMFFADSVRYTTSLGALPRLSDPWSPDFTVSIELLPGSDGWRGTATNPAAPGWTCGIWIGYIPAYLPGQKEAVTRCWKDR
jgi:uncharacterized protein YraI